MARLCIDIEFALMMSFAVVRALEPHSSTPLCGVASFGVTRL
jgi:hypothetical protein